MVKHSGVNNDLSLACVLDSKPHLVDVVVGTVRQSESHELGHILPNYPKEVLLAAQVTPTCHSGIATSWVGKHFATASRWKQMGGKPN